jgi:hypothetical protein
MARANAKPSRCRAQIGRCMRTLTLAGLAAALGAAPAGPAFSAPASCDIPKAANVRPGGLTALKAEEVARQLRGRRLRYLDLSPTIQDAYPAEAFALNGEWTWLGGRAPFPGAYELVDGGVIIRAGGEEQCRALFRDSGGQLFITGYRGKPQNTRPVASEPMER